MNMAVKFDKRLIISVFAMLVIATVFWLGSRYPALDEKALMGVDSSLSGLAFNALITVLPDSNAVWRAALNFVNWIFTNWRGMTFGILFGAALLTLLPLLQRLSFKNRIANAMLGIIIGAPLGVCVNCAAPIAKGLHKAGTRFETTIGALIASPTLNVIVLSISFALLPFYMAMTKLVLTLLFILLVVPLLGMWVARLPIAPEVIRPIAKQGRWAKLGQWWAYAGADVPLLTAANNQLLVALRWWVGSFARSLRFLALTTIPMMLAAGLIGTIIITVLPLEAAVFGFESQFSGPLLTLLGLFLIASFAILLPVPIAFDVIVVAILLGAGLDAKYAMVLLIALGGYSLVAFLIVGQAMSYRVATVLGAAIICMAVVAGVVGHVGSKWDQRLQLALIIDGISEIPAPKGTAITRPTGFSAAEIARIVAPNRVALQRLDTEVAHQGDGRIEVSAVQLNAKPKQSGPIFTRVIGPEIGLTEPRAISDFLAFPITSIVNATAAGDVNNDGWIDLVFNSDTNLGGLGLYINIGGQFLRQELDLGPVNNAVVGSVALVDLDNDGALDLYVSTFGQGNYVFKNHKGDFSKDHQIKLPDTGSIYTIAPSFADLDGDGDLDIVEGNSSASNVLGTGQHRKFAQESARDFVLWNEGGHFRVEKLKGVPGQTLTSLIWDINHDGLPDILVGDDFARTDKIYLNQGQEFRVARKEDGLLPYLLTTSMSFDLGDIDNDQQLEFYGVQISKSGENAKFGPAAVCDQLARDKSIMPAARDDCFTTLVYMQEAVNRSSSGRSLECNRYDKANGRGICRIYSYLRDALGRENPQRCAAFDPAWGHVKQICEQVSGPRPKGRVLREFAKTAISTGPAKRNVLFDFNQSGGNDIAADAGVETPGWGWNGRFTDLDQDGLQDLFVLTGQPGQVRYSSNVFYHNNGDRSFTQRQKAFGLEDMIPGNSYVLFDFDRDSDVDIVRGPSLGYAIVHRNDQPNGGAIWVRLRDELGNSHGIGAKLLLQVGDETLRRDIRASGGFASRDAAIVHFGIGARVEANTLLITWPDGAKTRIAGPISANSEILVTRKP